MPLPYYRQPPRNARPGNAAHNAGVLPQHYCMPTSMTYFHAMISAAGFLRGAEVATAAMAMIARALASALRLRHRQVFDDFDAHAITRPAAVPSRHDI